MIDSLFFRRIFRDRAPGTGFRSGVFAFSRSVSGWLGHLCGMNDDNNGSALEPVLTLTQVAEHFGVPVQTIHDLRVSGRGPRGFRIGRELHFRISEIRNWIARLEAEDGSTESDGGAR